MMNIRTLCFFLVFAITASFANKDKSQVTFGYRIGVVSTFPGNSGMFYNNRAKLIGVMANKSLFPAKAIRFADNVNVILTKTIAQNVSQSYKQHEFIQLRPINPEDGLTGYFIDGSWGPETKAVTLKGIKKLFDKHNLDSLIAIVPVTYYLDDLKGEASGMNLTFNKNELVFSATYAILVYAKLNSRIVKVFSSLKQVHRSAVKLQQGLTTLNRYKTEHVNVYYKLLEESFAPKVVEQIKGLLNGEPISAIFPAPSKPLFYFAK